MLSVVARLVNLFCLSGIFHLSAAHNQLGGAGVQSLLRTVSTDCLKQINLSCCNYSDAIVHSSFSTNVSQAFIAKVPVDSVVYTNGKL